MLLINPTNNAKQIQPFFQLFPVLGISLFLTFVSGALFGPFTATSERVDFFLGFPVGCICF